MSKKSKNLLLTADFITKNFTVIAVKVSTKNSKFLSKMAQKTLHSWLNQREAVA